MKKYCFLKKRTFFFFFFNYIYTEVSYDYEFDFLKKHIEQVALLFPRSHIIVILENNNNEMRANNISLRIRHDLIEQKKLPVYVIQSSKTGQKNAAAGIHLTHDDKELAANLLDNLFNNKRIKLDHRFFSITCPIVDEAKKTLGDQLKNLRRLPKPTASGENAVKIIITGKVNNQKDDVGISCLMAVYYLGLFIMSPYSRRMFPQVSPYTDWVSIIDEPRADFDLFNAKTMI